jgi:hypothetical protein
MMKIDDLLVVLTVGTPTTHRSLSVYPLERQMVSATAAYLVLDEALATTRFRITEVSESGAVPRLLALNWIDSPVFLLDGEELVGAKQNRVLNLSIMLASNSKTEIPVSCVEAGRWHVESPTFRSADRVQFARGRAQKMEQVSRSLCLNGKAVSDQLAVWNEISVKAARMNVVSATGAMGALFESRKHSLQNYLDAIPITDNQVGAVYAIGATIVGIEVFDSNATFKKLAGKLIASYALDAMEVGYAAEPPDARAVHTFISSVHAAPRHRLPMVGVGETVRLSSDEIVGAALEQDGRCVHLTAFRREMFGEACG